jgi:phytoene dehydrogenase-like protein
MSTPDAVVIGAGPNGLVAANRLVDAGWEVLVLEAQPTIGGAVRSDAEVHPEFVHDTFSAFYPLSAASKGIASFELEKYGLNWLHAPAVLGHPRRDAAWVLLHRDPEITARSLEADHPGDGDGWRSLVEQWNVIGPAIIAAVLAPFPPVRAGLAALPRLRRVGGMAFVKDLLEPASSFASDRLRGEGARLLLCGCAFHADIALNGAGSGLFGLLLTMMGQTVGWPVPEGGAGRLTGALANRLEANGGEIRCNAEVTGIEVAAGRAVAVRCGDERIAARRAIVANVAAEHLYGGLVSWDDLPSRTRTGMAKFQRDPATVKVDWALSGPVPWAETPAYAPGTVHIGDSVEDMMTSFAQMASGAVPASPMLLVGQMTTTDPSRSPAGTESLWAYTHVPQQVRHDAGESGITGRWDASDAERFADRMQARLQTYAPGFTDRIITRRILTPHDLQARNANLVGGSVNGGTAALHQEAIFRPVPGLGRAETPVRGLYLGSASAHPGGGVHGAPGMNAARAALAHARFRKFTSTEVVVDPRGSGGRG